MYGAQGAWPGICPMLTELARNDANDWSCDHGCGMAGACRAMLSLPAGAGGCCCCCCCCCCEAAICGAAVGAAESLCCAVMPCTGMPAPGGAVITDCCGPGGATLGMPVGMPGPGKGCGPCAGCCICANAASSSAFWNCEPHGAGPALVYKPSCMMCCCICCCRSPRTGLPGGTIGGCIGNAAGQLGGMPGSCMGCCIGGWPMPCGMLRRGALLAVEPSCPSRLRTGSDTGGGANADLRQIVDETRHKNAKHAKNPDCSTCTAMRDVANTARWLHT